MGGNTMPNRATVRSAGEAFRLGARALQDEFARGGPLHDLLLRYTQALMTQMLQTSVCNSHHSIDQRLCRWLLLTLDRSHSSTITTTQELISRMLGVRREGITEAIGKLQTSGLIETRRGSLAIVDRSGLEARVCECYRVVREEADRLIPRTESISNAPWGGRESQ
jgi:CRP-like cAMP-binding protein